MPDAPYAVCDEDVTDVTDEHRPCDKPAVALRIDPTFGGDPYPVCARHTRAPMVLLADVIRDAKAEAWDEGCRAGHGCLGAMSGAVCVSTQNPYRPRPTSAPVGSCAPRGDDEGAGVGMETGPVVSEGQEGE